MSGALPVVLAWLGLAIGIAGLFFGAVFILQERRLERRMRSLDHHRSPQSVRVSRLLPHPKEDNQ